jgi:hypothetical protein
VLLKKVMKDTFWYPIPLEDTKTSNMRSKILAGQLQYAPKILKNAEHENIILFFGHGSEPVDRLQQRKVR